MLIVVNTAPGLGVRSLYLLAVSQNRTSSQRNPSIRHQISQWNRLFIYFPAERRRSLAPQSLSNQTRVLFFHINYILLEVVVK